MKKQRIFKIEKIDRDKHWTLAQDKQLINLASQSSGRRNWKDIAAQIDHKTPASCYLRYKIINPNIRKGFWTQEEDQLILKGIDLYGKAWKVIAWKLFTNRTSKQIRDRFINYLDPAVDKSKFSVDEDLLLIELQKAYGNQWSKLKQYFPKRSSDALKNRFNSTLRKKIKLYNVIKCCSQTSATTNGNGIKDINN
jgi:hypothetical protein